jgi:hypothetical protein
MDIASLENIVAIVIQVAKENWYVFGTHKYGKNGFSHVGL